MRCPFCGKLDDKVIDSRQSRDALEIRRRRECEACGRRFTTYERIEEALPLVIKADGRREPFDRNKIKRGLSRAAAKRPVPVEALSTLAEQIERETCDTGVREISTRDIGELLLPRACVLLMKSHMFDLLQYIATFAILMNLQKSWAR